MAATKMSTRSTTAAETAEKDSGGEAAIRLCKLRSKGRAGSGAEEGRRVPEEGEELKAWCILPCAMHSAPREQRKRAPGGMLARRRATAVRNSPKIAFFTFLLDHAFVMFQH